MATTMMNMTTVMLATMMSNMMKHAMDGMTMMDSATTVPREGEGEGERVTVPPPSFCEAARMACQVMPA